MTPRIPPMAVDELDPEIKELVTNTLTAPDGEVLNIFRTLAHHPWVLKRFLAMGNQLLLRAEMPGREREILILRTGWNTQSEYEWGQHVAIGRAFGLTDVELARIKAGPGADGWSAADATLLRAADELHEGSVITGETWNDLKQHFPDEKILMEIPLLVGFYHLVAYFLNSTGVEREPGVAGLDTP